MEGLSEGSLKFQLFQMHQIGFYDGFGEGDDVLGIGGFGEFDGSVFIIQNPDAFIFVLVSFTVAFIRIKVERCRVII